MSIVAAPILHVIKDPTDWPQEISDISHHFFHPLPKCVASKAHERRQFLSLGCWELYDEALGSHLFAVKDEDRTGQPTIAVTDVIDSILSCVMMVKVASSVSVSRGHKQARLSWISLLVQLGIGISEDMIFLEDTMFLRARTTEKSVVTDVEDLVGRSSLFLATLLNSPLDSNGTNGTPMIVDEAETEIRSCNSSNAVETSSDGLSIPLDAHILPGCGKRMNCVLPVVCVAPEHEIEALLTSVVCQRYVLNISLPVVGLSLPTSGTTAKIVLGWVEGRGDDYDAVPVIHTACGQGDNIHPSVGVFDLLDPASMLYFAQFILRLQPYFSSIRESDTLQARNFCWRLDHIRYEHPTHNPDSSTNDLSWIKAWFRGLCAEISEPRASDTNDQSSTDAMPPKKGSSSTQSKASSSSQFLEVPPQSRRGRSSRSRPIVASPQQQIPGSSGSSSSSDENENSDPHSRSPSPASGLTASYYPASRFAKLAPNTGALEKWLWERRTFRLFRIELFQPDSEMGKQVCAMIQEYNDMIKYSWPGAWDNISKVPSRDSVHENIRKRLFDSYQEYKTHNSNFPPMEEEVFCSINNHISALYRAVANAQASQQQAKVKEAKEAALRSSWDELLKAVCCDVNAASSTYVIVETSIPLPRNKATDLGSMFGADAQALVPESILSKQLYASARNATNRVPDAIRMALTISYLHAQASTPSACLKPEDRAYEPATAIIDAVCYLQYDIQKEKSKDTTPGKDKMAEVKLETKKKEKPAGWMSRFIKRVSAREIHIPYLFAEYKRDPSGEYQAFHQAQMYVTFGVEFLAALGIRDEPVWALVTSGTTGTIIMAWKSTAPNSNTAVEYNFIIDQYVRSFDITQPLEALQLMACLRRIYQRGSALQATLAQRIDPSVFTNPTAAIQDKMMPPRTESKAEA